MVERVALLYDIHAPYHHPPALANATKFVADYLGNQKDAVLGFGGDTYDFYLASNYTRMDSGKGPQLLVDELKMGWEAAVKPLVEAAPKARKFALGGNHEARGLRLVAAAAPMLKGAIDFEDLMNYKKAGIQYVQPHAGNAVYSLTDKLDVMHGWKTGVTADRASLLRYGKSLVFGHTHKASYRSERFGAGHTLSVWVSGCLSATNPDYVSMPDWTWGFMSGWIDKETGLFDLNHCTCAGDNLEMLFTPQGSYHAMFKGGRNGQGGEWVSKRLVWF